MDRAIRTRIRRVSAGFGGPAALAKRLGATPAAVRHWMGGRNLPNPDTLYAFARLGVSPDWLLLGAGKAPKLPYPTTKTRKGTR